MGAIKNKKGIFFSTDALIATIIILLTIIIVYPTIKSYNHHSEISEDIFKVLSTLKIGEVNNSYAKNLVSTEKITDLNKSVLEQIGEFYNENITLAKELAQSVLADLDTKDNIGIWFGYSLIAAKNSTPYENLKNIEVETQVISGIENQTGGNFTGYSARAFLSKSFSVSYFYFGGYVGDGNLSANITYYGEIKNVNLEITINDDFDLYINNNFSGHYAKSVSEFSPQVYNISSYINRFYNGSNIIEFKGNGLYIAGGYIKITHETSTQTESSKKYFFPGINGVVNIYDGFYIPGKLENMSVFLHYKSNYTMFLNIGNTTVFNGSSSSETRQTIPSSTLSSLLNYNFLSNKTIPIRLGLENVSYVSNITQPVDVFSVADLSGSMADACGGGSWICCLFSGGCTTQAKCSGCGGVWQPKISSLKEANNAFVDSILNNTGNKVGLVTYRNTGVYASGCLNLTNNASVLKTKINTWSASGNTPICAGIINATKRLERDSSQNRLKAMVVMSDGEANVLCSEIGTGNAKNDAINAACLAKNSSNITVYAVGFGSDTDTATLQAIANCGGGKYYYSNITDIINIYNQIAQDVIEASYNEQTISVTGNISTILYPDSYILFDSSGQETNYGLITTYEQPFTDSSSGNFSIPSDSKVIKTNVISYSGPRWTSTVSANNQYAYKLSDYGSNFVRLGDPYSINIPNNLIITGANNINLTTGLSPTNLSSGSSYNKIIYTLIKNISAYSPISDSADGCIWNIEFEDSSNITIRIPLTYSGTSECKYNSAEKEYDENDAIQTAVYNLFILLDTEPDGKIDFKFSEQDLQISSSTITGIPYIKSTEVQVRRWY